MMSKHRIYLDTSVIGFLEQPLEPLKMAATMGFCRILKEHSEHYEVSISALTMLELRRSPDFLRQKLLGHLKELHPLFLRRTAIINTLHAEYIQNKVLPDSCSDDMLHLSYAVHHQCDTVVSWNFKHFVNNTIRNLQKANARLGRSTPEIISPSTFLERAQNE